MLFGTYRYILANIVVVAHFYPWPLSGAGPYAVFGFFILSGFLMTYILNKTYGWSTKGIAKYALNRVLRIYPSYYVVSILSLVLIIFFPEPIRIYNPTLRFPDSLQSWLHNIFIFGSGPLFSPLKEKPIRFISVAWSLHVEMIFYLLMLVIARSFKHSLCAIFIGMTFCTYYIFTNVPFAMRVVTLQAALLPFSLGTVLYYVVYKSDLFPKRLFNVYILLTMYILMFINVIFARRLMDPLLAPFYLNLVLQAVIIVILSRSSDIKISSFVVKLDRFLGDLSYPIYLAHPLVGFLVMYFIFRDQKIVRVQGDALFCFVSMIAVNVFAMGIALFVERYLQKIRDRVRGYAVK